MRGAITGLTLAHDRAAIARSVLEGVAFAIRGQLDLLRVAGTPVTELRVSGGDARLAAWNQVKADVTGLRVVPFPGDAATSGVAMLAGLGSGIFRDATEAIAGWVRPGPQVAPDPAAVERYEAVYPGYQALADSAVVRREDD
jgi:xylulokinase